MAGGSLGEVNLTVNGATTALRVDPATKLLYILRNDLRLNGPKFGCGLGECGACMVLVDGVAARSCVITVGAAVGHAITTLEGLGSSAAPHPVQQAFIDEQAAQCGYCLNRMIIAPPLCFAATRTRRKRRSVRRCGTHIEIIRAVQRAAGMPA